jgi:ABC-type glycerol-3-phosphate transport system permease component
MSVLRSNLLSAKTGSQQQNRSPRSRSTRLLLYVLLVLVALVFLGPLYWLGSSALKASGDIYRYPPAWIPARPKLSNFSHAWHAAPFERYFINSLIVTGAGAAIKIVNATCTAYAFTFLRFPLKRVIFVLILGTLMVPGNVTLIVNYLTMSDLGWVNSYLGLIIPSAGSAFGTFLLRQHMLTLPNEVMEAARVDGAGHLRILWQMVVPMSRPMLVTVTIIAVVDMWNEFIWPLIITNTADMRTLPIGLLQLKSDEGYNDWGAIMAGTTMVALPILLLFLITQRYIVAGLTSGAVKG